MMRFLYFILALPLIISATPSRSFGNGKETLSCDQLSSLLSDGTENQYYGGYIIDSGDTLRGSTAVIGGSLDIQSGGVLLGDAWIVNGRVVLTGNAVIQGSLNLVSSDKYISRLSRITGGSFEYRSECELDYDTFSSESKVQFSKVDDPASLRIEPSLQAGRPCRVDYNILRLGLKRFNPRHKEPYISFDSHIHLPLWKEEGGFLGFDAELNIPLIDQEVDLYLRGFKITETNDDWQLSRLENGIIVTMTGDDFADYYEIRGAEAGLKIRRSDYLVVEPSISYASDISLTARGIPSLLFPRDRFRPNPPIREGNRLAARLKLKLDSRDDSGWRYGGWKLGLALEKGIADGPGDFSYSLIDIDLARYNEIARGLRFDLRSKLFTTFGEIPPQKSMSVNGYGGIRGLSDFPFTPRRGNRLALFTAEVRKSIPPLPLLGRVCSRMNLLLFSDNGILAAADNPDKPFDFSDNPGENFKSTIGFGISTRSILPCMEFYIAEDLEEGDFSPRFILRAERAF
ncbi:MAG: BamA/TamA family outer membrane protein [Candidatus Latescibacteria bacterium]|nr:BamA/TamA family outer membrane protein [bacterium]MBD3423651.1 BamA/TamA family outer membrane protein [Candidatus Latescibacterota bacterium]